MHPKKFFLFFSFSLFAFHFSLAQSPSWAWARSAGTVSDEYSNATCTDANGNVYITGTFQGDSITFGSTTLHNTATGSLDIFIVKYDAAGNVLWARSGGGTKNDYAYGICADAGGNVCITGYFYSTSMTFGTITLTNTGTYTNVFVTKYDHLGNSLWGKSAISIGIGLARSLGICTDADSSIYITGEFNSDTLIFGNYILSNTIPNGGYTDIFIAKYDAGGNVLWAVGGIGNAGQNVGQSICTDENRNVYVTGYFGNYAIFGSDTLIGGGLFIAKYNSHGVCLWAKDAFDGNGYGYGTGISADKDGNAYIIGWFAYSIALGGDTLGNAGGGNNFSIFIAKYDSSGNPLWGRTPGGTGADYGTGICTDSSGNVFVTGYFASSYLNFGGHAVLNANVGYDDVFVAKYDGAGNALWATGVGGPDNDYGMGVCAGTGSVYVTGYFGSYNCTFGSTTLTNNGSYDVFLAKLSSINGINELVADNNSLFIYPNPANGEFRVWSSEFAVGGTIEIYDVMGERVYSERLNSKLQTLNPKLNAGVYFVQLRNEERVYTGKVVVE